jgi:hypothetical protein
MYRGRMTPRRGEGGYDNRLSRASLTGQHTETLVEFKLGSFEQSDIADGQLLEHYNP